MARQYRIRIYDIGFATLLGTLSDDALWRGKCDTAIAGEDSLRFEVDKRHADAALLALGRVAELYKVDESWKRPFRISNFKSVRDGSKYFYEVECEHLKYDLARQIHLFTGDLIEQTPATHINLILNGSGWSAGTVTPTTRLTKTYNNNTRLFDLQELADKTGYELNFTATAGGSRTVSLVRIGNQNSTSNITFGKNLKSLTRDFKLPEANRVYGIGGDGENSIGMSIGTATHRITAVNFPNLALDSQKIVSSNGSWDGYNILNVDTGATDLVTGSFKGSGSDFDAITVLSGGDFNIGDRLRFTVYDFPNEAVKYIDYIEDKDSIDTYGQRHGKFVDESYSDVINLVGPYNNSALSGTYSSGLCEGWLKLGTCTVAENSDTTYVINGSKSQRVTVSAWNTTPSAPTVAQLTGVQTELVGTRQYKIAWLTSDGEGPLSSAGSVALNKTIGHVTLNQSPPETRITGWRLYATKMNGSTFYKISDMALTTPEFFDMISDDNLTIEPPVSTAAAAGGQGVYREFVTEIGSEYAAVIYFTVVTGRVRVELVTTEAYPGREVKSNKAATPTVTGAQFFIASIDGLVALGTTGSVRIVAHEGPADFYVDSVMVVKSPYAPNSDRFVADNMATELWYEAFDYLQKNKSPEIQYSINASDLYEMGIGADAFRLGDNLTVTDPALGISSALRIVRKSFNIVMPNEATFEFSNVARRLTDFVRDTKYKQQIVTRAMQRQFTRVSSSIRAEVGTNKSPRLSIEAAAKVDVSGQNAGWKIKQSYVD